MLLWIIDVSWGDSSLYSQGEYTKQKRGKKLNYLETCIEKGEDLNSFLTRSIKKLSQEDSMLYDWNICHFHLSDQLDSGKKDGFMVCS